MKTFGIALLVFAGLAFFSACENTYISPVIVHVPPINPKDTVKFSKDIEPLFTTYDCINCHNGSFEFDLKVGHAYNSLKTNNLIDTPAVTSLLMIRLNVSPPHNGTDKFTTDQKQKISKWINDGTKNN